MTVIPLAEATDVAVVGGKSLALGQLIRAGYNVPAGFIIPAEANLAEAEILRAFDELGATTVAVRSSATNEDGQDASWAGQFDTFLNVNRNELMDKIGACIASVTSPGATAYGKPGAVAVIAQTMVRSEISGVAFSVNPVTNNADQIIIEAVKGLGEALVSGQVTPDNYVVGKTKGEITNKTIVPSGSTQKLTDEQIHELAVLVTKLEKDFGYPVDVEWAWAKEQLYVLQCRPVTGLN